MAKRRIMQRDGNEYLNYFLIFISLVLAKSLGWKLNSIILFGVITFIILYPVSSRIWGWICMLCFGLMVLFVFVGRGQESDLMADMTIFSLFITTMLALCEYFRWKDTVD